MGVGQTLIAAGAGVFGASLVAWALMETAPPPKPAPKPAPRQQELFTRRHPCPANGKVQASCPGYVVSYVKPLCAGGADRIANMQWQSVADAKKKDRETQKLCAKPAKAAESRSGP